MRECLKKHNVIHVKVLLCTFIDEKIYKIGNVLGDTKKREPLKNPTKIEEIQEKKLLTEIEPLQLAF